jgi:DNA-directed RNA polymerase specialized sigma24 family protein
MAKWLGDELLAIFANGRWPADRVSELVQDTVADIFHKLEKSPDDPELFRGWVHSFAGTEILTSKRDRRRQKALLVELRARGRTPIVSAGATMVDPLIDEQQRQLAIQHALRLRTRYRNAFLHVLDGGDYKSLAAGEGISEGAAAGRISYAAKLVRRSIQAHRRTRTSCRTPTRNA